MQTQSNHLGGQEFGEASGIPLVLALAALGDLPALRSALSVLIEEEGLRPHIVWSHDVPMGEAVYTQALRKVTETLGLAGLLNEANSLALDALRTTANSIVVLDLEGPLICRRFGVRSLDASVVVPAHLWSVLEEAQRKRLAEVFDALPALSFEAACERARELTRDLAKRDNVVILCEAFESVPAAGDASAMRLAADLEGLNLLARELSAEYGALVCHVNAGLSHVGGDALGADYRKQGARTAQVIADELSRVLRDGGGLDVFRD